LPPLSQSPHRPIARAALQMHPTSSAGALSAWRRRCVPSMSADRRRQGGSGLLEQRHRPWRRDRQHDRREAFIEAAAFGGIQLPAIAATGAHPAGPRLS